MQTCRPGRIHSSIKNIIGAPRLVFTQDNAFKPALLAQLLGDFLGAVDGEPHASKSLNLIGECDLRHKLRGGILG